MSLLINEIASHQVLTSYNFARISNKVFAEVVTPKQYAKLSSNNTYEIYSNSNQVLYKKKLLEIQENDIIFCNTYLIESLFKELNKIKNLTNIKIITSQTDHLITKKLFNKKPTCVSDWFSINVGYSDHSLHPIPLGLSNNYSEKNLHQNLYFNLKPNYNKRKSIYTNFQVNTNYLHRRGLQKLTTNRNLFKNSDANLSLSEYLQNLNDYKFTICPWGNGIDTHRLWETLYAGSIPIVKNHMTYKTLDDLNAILLDSYSDISEDILDEHNTSKKFEVEKLTISYWNNLMCAREVNSSESHILNHSEEQNEYTKYSYYQSLKRENYIKELMTFQRKILKKLNY
jgi:hypothetical protein